MTEGKEGYQPSGDEIRSAEEHITEKEAAMSEAREEMAKYKDKELKEQHFWDTKVVLLNKVEPAGLDVFKSSRQRFKSALSEKFGPDFIDKVNFVKVNLGADPYDGEFVLNVFTSDGGMEFLKC